MTRADEFTSFYRSTSADALRVTYALCGDRQVALEATVDAYRRAWRDWSKVRDHRPLSYVRNEAWKLTALARGTHPLRRRHEEDADTELLGALHDLPVDDRRLIVLLTLGDTDLEKASREVGLSEEDGIERVTTALDALEAQLGQPLEQLESRLRDLGTVTGTLEMPPADTVRQRARRGRRRNTVLLVAAAVVAVLGGGFVVTEGDSLASEKTLPYREKIGAERPDVVLQSREVSAEDLLSADQLSDLDEDRPSWKVAGTDESLDNTTPYATCPTTRFADEDPLRVFVRTYEGRGTGNARVAQAIEVSRSDDAAQAAFEKTLSWYADCAHPRVQLTGSWVVERPFGDFQILRLRSHRSPERIFTVGFAHSGSVTSTLVHEEGGAKGPSIQSFADTLNESVAKVCRDSGGRCSDAIDVKSADPPRTSTAPEFLGVVDMPPIADIDKVWSGIDPFKPKVNPAATLCDAADFKRKEVRSWTSRVFVIPEAVGVPREFGVAETVGRATSEKAAKAFFSRVRDKVDACPDDNLSATVDAERTVEGDGFSGRVWRLRFEVEKGRTVEYRMGVVRRGAMLAQVTFTPSGDFDVKQDTFEKLVQRAGERLVYAAGS